VIDSLNLQRIRNQLSDTLSGGNKRKLSVGIAIIGNPSVILLDEPSAGMDPEARRHLWQVISAAAQNSSVVLTTHSMEEAEALSTKMGIMLRGGTFQCMGSGMHIKNKYGTGYEVEFKILKMRPEDVEK
jgi:ATP-binding cassette subfamily A (ABC1) protein 3